MQDKRYSGFVLKRHPLREADEAVTMWTWEEGKVRFLIRSVKKGTSKLKGALTPLAWIELDTVGSSSLPVVVGTRLVKSYAPAGRTLERLADVFAMFELVLRTTVEGEANAAISLLVRGGLETLAAPADPPPDFLPVFRIRLLDALGYGIQLGRCVSCGTALSGKERWWSDIFMAPLCDRCRRHALGVRKLPAPVLEYVEAVQSDTDLFPQTGDRYRNAPGVDEWLAGALEHLADRRLRASEFLHDPRTRSDQSAHHRYKN